MKTIWILNHHAVTPDIGGGTRHYDFAKELVQRGYQVYVFASSFIHYQYVNLLNDNEKSKELDIDGIHWVWINTGAYHGNGKDRILGMIRYYRFMMENYRNYPRPDNIIGSAVHLLACLAGYRISRKVGAKSISEIRDLWPETLIQLGSLKRSSPIAKIMHGLEKYIYKKSDKIIVTAPGMADYIKQTGINRKKIVYISNGVDIQSFDSRLEQYCCDEVINYFKVHKFNVVYLGAMGKANALDTLVEASKLMNDRTDISFSLIGEGPEKERLRIKAAELGIRNIHFFPSVAKQYVPSILGHADCLIFSASDSPLYKYGISANKIFDYLCSGKPIVFAINSLNDPIKDSGGGISITPESAERMAEAILNIYTMDTQEREDMGKKGRHYAEENYDIPILINKLEEVLRA